MRALAAAGLAGLGVSTVLYAIAAAEVRRLRKTAVGHRVPGFTPAVSILKPLRGLDEDLEEDLEEDVEDEEIEDLDRVLPPEDTTDEAFVEETEEIEES